jgi:general stress protein CsbA
MMMTAVTMMKLMKIMMMVGRSNTTNVITIDTTSFVVAFLPHTIFVLMCLLMLVTYSKFIGTPPLHTKTT